MAVGYGTARKLSSATLQHLRQIAPLCEFTQIRPLVRGSTQPRWPDWG